MKQPFIREMVRDSVAGLVNHPGGGGAAGLIAGLFAQGQQGFWLPFTDFASLSQDSAGTLPYTALEQPMGLVLDKSRGLVLGGELALAPLTTTNSANTFVGANVSAVASGDANQVTFAGSQNNSANNFFGYKGSLLVGTMFEIVFKAKWISGGSMNAGPGFNVGLTTSSASNGGVFKEYSLRIAASNPTVGTGTCVFSGDAGAVWEIKDISYKQVLGNHAVQPTSTARGVVSARVNMLQSTEEWAGLPWTKTGTGAASLPIVTDNYGLAPDGTMTAARVQMTTNGGNAAGDISKLSQGAPVIAGTSYTQKVYIKSLTGPTVISFRDDLSSVVQQLVTITNDWQLIGGAGVASVSSSVLGLWLRPAIGTAFAADYLVWHPSMTTTAQASLPYQRVTTPTDYDAVGFPKYAKLEVDDYYTCGGGGSTTGFYYSDVIRPMGGAGTRRVIWSDRSGNNGYELAINASNKLELSAGNGTAITAVASTVSATVADGKRYEVMDDGAVLSVQIDGSAPVTVARPVVTAGSSTITLYRGASTGYFNGQVTEPIYRAGPPPSASERATIMGYQKQKAGL